MRKSHFSLKNRPKSVVHQLESLANLRTIEAEKG